MKRPITGELPVTIHDETNDLIYDLVGDYYYPRLTLPEEPDGDIGRYGRMRKRFLQEHRKGDFAEFLMNGNLKQHLMAIDREANEQIELITAQLAKAEGVTEEVKARDQLGWIRAMNFCRARAEEQVVREIVLA